MAEQTASTRAAVDYCLHLCCKEKFVDMGEPFDLRDSGSGIYWCAHTQTCIGPDGQLVHVTDCKSGRACFEVC